MSKPREKKMWGVWIDPWHTWGFVDPSQKNAENFASDWPGQSYIQPVTVIPFAEAAKVT